MILASFFRGTYGGCVAGVLTSHRSDCSSFWQSVIGLNVLCLFAFRLKAHVGVFQIINFLFVVYYAGEQTLILVCMGWRRYKYSWASLYDGTIVLILLVSFYENEKKYFIEQGLLRNHITLSLHPSVCLPYPESLWDPISLSGQSYKAVLLAKIDLIHQSSVNISSFLSLNLSLCLTMTHGHISKQCNVNEKELHRCKAYGILQWNGTTIWDWPGYIDLIQ